MNEVLYLPQIDKQDCEELAHVKAGGEKDLQKQIKKLKRWMAGFKDSPDNFFRKESYTVKDYDQLFSDMTVFAKFFNRKLKQMVTNAKIFRKFRKMIVCHLTIVGICGSINAIIEYFQVIKTKTIADKKTLGYDLGNDIINGVYEKFKTSIYQLLQPVEESKEVLDKIFLNEKQLRLVLFDPSPFASLVVRYLNQLQSNKIKKITSEINLLGNYKAMVCVVTVRSFKHYYQTFLANIH